MKLKMSLAKMYAKHTKKIRGGTNVSVLGGFKIFMISGDRLKWRGLPLDRGGFPLSPQYLTDPKGCIFIPVR